MLSNSGWVRYVACASFVVGNLVGCSGQAPSQICNSNELAGASGADPCASSGGLGTVGGSSSPGGETSTGGSANTGGSQATASTTGGAATGGDSSTGGATGGQAPTGGAEATGGAATGGQAATGGAAPGTGGSGTGLCTGTGGNPDIVVTPTSNLVTSETGTQDSFSIVLAAAPTADVTVGMSTSDSTEASMVTASVTFTPANWCIAQAVKVQGLDDTLVDGPQSYVIVTAAAVSGDARYDGLNPANVSAINTDNDTAGVVIANASNLTTTEAGGTAQFTVALNTQPTGNVSFAVSSNDATEGATSVSFLAFTPTSWNTPQTITVTGVDDFVADGTISYSVVLGPITSSDVNFNSVDPPDVTVRNLDNDVPGFVVTPSTGLITSESATTASFTVKLTTQPTANVTVPIQSNNLAEGSVSVSSLTFQPANWNVGQIVTITGVDDAVVDGNQPFVVALGAAVSTDPLYNSVDPPDVQATNYDNDSASFIVTPTSGLQTSEGGVQATFSVKLSAQPTAEVTFFLSSNDTTEGVASASSLTFDATNWNLAQVVTVTGQDDTIEDGNVAYKVVLYAAVSSDGKWNGIDPPDVSLTNLENDWPQIAITPSSGLQTSEGGGTATFSVSLSRPPTANVSFTLYSSDTTEGTVSPTTVTFTATDYAPRTVVVTGVDDYLADGAVAYTIVTSNATSTDPGYIGTVISDVSVANADDDVPGVKVFPTAGLQTTEFGGTASFTTVLTVQPSASVTINLTSSDTTEGTLGTSALTFTTSNWNTPQTVTVTGINDTLVDGNMAYTVVTSVTSSDTFYSSLAVDDVSLTNMDNDPYLPCSNPGTIDDMEDQDLAICPNQGRLGSWHKTNDGYGTQTLANVSVSGPLDSNFGIETAGSGFSSWGAVLGTDLNNPGTGRLPYNLVSPLGTAYTGITFWAKRNGTGPARLYVQIPTTATALTTEGGTCSNSLYTCNDHYVTQISPPTTWTQYKLPFSGFRQLGWGTAFTKDFTRSLGIEFLVRYSSYYSITDAYYSWDYSIDDLALY